MKMIVLMISISVNIFYSRNLNLSENQVTVSYPFEIDLAYSKHPDSYLPKFAHYK